MTAQRGEASFQNARCVCVHVWSPALHFEILKILAILLLLFFVIISGLSEIRWLNGGVEEKALF